MKHSGTPLVVSVFEMNSVGLNAAWRAAHVAMAWGAALHIVHAARQPRLLSREEKSLRELAENIEERTRLKPSVESLRGGILKYAVTKSREAAVMVLPSTRGNPLREWIMGTQAEQLIRLCRSPVLVVKRPALRPYRRVLVPVDIEERAVPLVTLGASLSREARLEVLHAIDVRDEQMLRGFDESEETLRGLRQHRARVAFHAVHQLISSARVPEAGVEVAEAAVEFGNTQDVVLARAGEWDAELMVIGKAQRGLLAEYLLGGLTQRILARAPADVLIYPGLAHQAGTTRQQAVGTGPHAKPPRTTLIRPPGVG